MKRHLIITIVAFFLISGCKKNTSDLPNEQLPVYLPTVYTNMGQIYAPCKFDDRNRLTEYSIDKSVTKLIYDSNDRVIEADFYYNDVLNRKLTYTYDGSIITEKGADIFNGAQVNPFTQTIALNSAQKPIAEGNISYNYDNAGNIVSMVYYYSPTSILTKSFTYDNKNSSLKNIKGNYYIVTRDAEFTNNMTSYIQTLYDGIKTTIVSPTTYSNYIYNSDGYPVSRLVKSTAGLNYIQQYFYTVR